MPPCLSVLICCSSRPTPLATPMMNTSQSVWTVDLCWVLCQLQVPFRMFTTSLHVRDEYRNLVRQRHEMVLVYTAGELAEFASAFDRPGILTHVCCPTVNNLYTLGILPGGDRLRLAKDCKASTRTRSGGSPSRDHPGKISDSRRVCQENSRR